jgi:hypothetical protein
MATMIFLWLDVFAGMPVNLAKRIDDSRASANNKGHP